MNTLEIATPATGGSMIDQDALKKQFPVDSSSDQPVFILSAGWRSGSTLLQRMCTTRDRIIWGEPYGHANLISHLASPLRAVTEQWPPENFFFDENKVGELDSSWIANMYPDRESLGLAYRAFFQELFARTAHEAGFSEWGCKFVRVTADGARMLRWLWPECKILYLVRNPMDAWRSYYRITSGRCDWYLEWPDGRINAERFAEHWSRCVESFLSQEDSLLVRYEQLRRGVMHEQLKEYLGEENVNLGALRHVRGKSGRRLPVPKDTLRIIACGTADQREQLGYLE